MSSSCDRCLHTIASLRCESISPLVTWVITGKFVSGRRVMGYNGGEIILPQAINSCPAYKGEADVQEQSKIIASHIIPLSRHALEDEKLFRG